MSENMKRSSRRPFLPILLLAGLGLAGPAAAEEERPGWLEGLLYNPAERTREGAAALDAGAPEAASEALEVAMRLAPADEKARYNAGTAHLLAASEKAAPLLESAAKSNDKTVSARAYYNLGNARMAAQDFQGAIEAYKDSLRRDPTSADAKFNLELAWRRLQEQQQQNQQQQEQDQQKQDQQQKEDQQKQDQDQPKQEQEEGQEGQEGQKGKEGQQDQEQQSQEQEQKGQQKDPQDQQQQQPKPGQKGQSSPLPQFRDLPDMDAQQAAAILEAIENLERAQRRTDAKKALKANVRGKKDW